MLCKPPENAIVYIPIDLFHFIEYLLEYFKDYNKQYYLEEEIINVLIVEPRSSSQLIACQLNLSKNYVWYYTLKNGIQNINKLVKKCTHESL